MTEALAEITTRASVLLRETRRGLNQKRRVQWVERRCGLVEEKLAGRAAVPPMSRNEQRCLRSLLRLSAFAFVGPSGFGKSSNLRCFNRLVEPSSASTDEMTRI